MKSSELPQKGSDPLPPCAVLPAATCSPPEWLEEVIEAIGITDGVDLVKWHQDKDGDYIVEIEYGEEEMSFIAGTDGESHGADYEGTIHDMTAPSDVQWWCAGELYMRLQKAKRRLEDLEAKPEVCDCRGKTQPTDTDAK